MLKSNFERNKKSTRRNQKLDLVDQLKVWKKKLTTSNSIECDVLNFKYQTTYD